MENLNSKMLFEKFKSIFSNCFDFNAREIPVTDNFSVYLINLGNYSDRAFISETIVKPLTQLNVPIKNAKHLMSVVSSNEFAPLLSFEEAQKSLLSGGAIVLCDSQNEGTLIFFAMAKGGAARSVSEPDSEVVIRGPREGFVENAADNIALLRKRLRTPDFKSERLFAGKITNTDIYICYLDGVCDKNTLSSVKEVISQIEIPSVMDSGYIEHYLQKKTPSLFTNVGNSEKPDKVAAKLCEGRIAIICDTSPIVLTVPYLFVESLQSSEDYLKTPFYATFIRCIRFTSLIFSLFLPSLYLALLEHHSQVLPHKLFMTALDARKDIPFSLFGELLVILIIFELVREVGVRMPRAVGDAVGIVAGLILGDAAISAGIASSQVIMVAALCAVSSFALPPLMNSIVLIRFIILIVTKLLGFEGIVISCAFLIIYLCKKESFGVPYFTPFSPLSKKGVLDSILSVPKKALKAESYKKDDI